MWISKEEYQDLKAKVNALCNAHHLTVKYSQHPKGLLGDELETHKHYTCNHSNINLSKMVETTLRRDKKAGV